MLKYIQISKGNRKKRAIDKKSMKIKRKKRGFFSRKKGVLLENEKGVVEWWKSGIL